MYLIRCISRFLTKFENQFFFDFQSDLTFALAGLRLHLRAAFADWTKTDQVYVE